MEKEILDLIKAKLPEQEVGIIRKMATDLEASLEKIKTLDLALSDTRKKYDELSVLNHRFLDLNTREVNIKTMEHDLVMKSKEMEIQQAQFEAQVYKDTIHLVLRNTEIKKVMTKNVLTTTTNPGGYSTSYATPVRDDELTTEE